MRCACRPAGSGTNLGCPKCFPKKNQEGTGSHLTDRRLYQKYCQKAGNGKRTGEVLAGIEAEALEETPTQGPA